MFFSLNTAPQVFARLGHTVTGLSAPSGDLGDTISRRLVNSPSRPQSFTPTSSSANKYARPCRLCSKQKKSELDLTQDIHFLGIRLRLDLGEASLSESKAWEIVARTRHLSSLHVLTYTQVSQLMGSLNWASGLGRLYLRHLQRHFHLLDLTDRFTPPCRSDPLVPANLLRCAGPTFSYLRNPSPHFSGGVHDFYGRLHAGVGRSHGGFPDFG